MEITLNREPLDITIENEKILKEMIEGIKDWLDQTGYELTDMIVDEKEFQVDGYDWHEISLEDISRIDLTAVSKKEKYITDLQVIYQYVTMLNTAVKAGNSRLVADLLKELPAISGGMDYFLSKNGSPSYETVKLGELIQKADPENGPDSTGNEELTAYLNALTLLFRDRINEIADPFTEMNNSAAKLTGLIPDISDVSVMLQTGKDRKAMDTVLMFIELSEKIIRLFPFLKDSGYSDITGVEVDSGSFGEFYRDYNGVLQELTDAFDINDTILIGDLMEYEIVPRVEKLLEYINLIEKVQE